MRRNETITQRDYASAEEEPPLSVTDLKGRIQPANDAMIHAEGLVRGATASLQTMERLAHSMEGIARASQCVWEISALIDGVAFQAHLLALKASVEAARVGEQARGFGEVAAQVRALAQQSAQSAHEINVLIAASQDQPSGDNEAAERARKTMQDVARTMQRLARIVHDMRYASEAQSTGVAQLYRAMAQLQRLSQHHATRARQGTDAGPVGALRHDAAASAMGAGAA